MAFTLIDQVLAESPFPAEMPHAFVVRSRLVRLIQHPQLASITLITTPAGFGKSTVAAQWAARQPEPVPWVTLDAACNNPETLLARLAAAIDGDAADQRESIHSLPNVDDVVAKLVRLVDARGSQTVIIDDYHLIANRDVHQAMDGLIAHLPTGVHLVILSRTLPPLSLGRLRVQGRVRELTEADLRFDQYEAEALIADHVRNRLSRDQVERLAERAQGWIAGLRLSLLALERVADDQIDAFIDAYAEHQWLDDYIIEEVLADLPPELRAFIQRTADLGPLTPELCDAVLQIDHSAALIDEAARRLVFARRDARGGAGVRYHPLFAEAVAGIAKPLLPAGEFKAQHRRAAEWFATHRRPEEALEHAVAAEDWDLAQDVARALGQELRDRDQSHSLRHWLGKLPESVLIADPDLAFWYIRALLVTGEIREGFRLFRLVEPLWQTLGDPYLSTHALSCEAFIAAFEGDTDRSLELLYQRLPNLPPDKVVDRLHVWSGIYGWEFARCNDAAADAAYLEAERIRALLPAEQRWWTLSTELGRVNQYALRGDLPAAERLCRFLLDRLPGQFRDAEAQYRRRLAAIYLEWNDLGPALAETERVVSDLEVFPWQYWHPEAWLNAA